MQDPTISSSCSEVDNNLRIQGSGPDIVTREIVRRAPVFVLNRAGDRKRIEEYLCQQVFGIPLILKEILSYLPFKDLLTTSLVNKSWNFFSREILRKLNCVAVIESHETSCDYLLMLNKLLANTENVPFNGLCVTFTSTNDNLETHQCVGYENLSDFSCHILSKICIKFLEVVYDDEKTCVAVDLIRRILGERAESLEVFSLEHVSDDATSLGSWLGIDLKGPWLPKLHTLLLQMSDNLYDQIDEFKVPCSMVEEIVEGAPNLRVIRGYIHPECLGPILKKKLVPVLTNFHYRPPPELPETRKWVREFVMTNPKLHSFSFSTHIKDFDHVLKEEFSKWPRADQDEVGRNLSWILQSSKDRLVHFDTDQLSLILMMSQWNIPVMHQVRCLGIWHSAFLEINSNVPTLSKLDWSKNFPNLKEVCIFNISFPRDTNQQVYLNESFRLRDAQFCCQTVNKLTVKGHYEHESNPDRFDVRQMQVFRDIFPNVKKLIVSDINQFSELMTQMWTLWPNLEGISVSALMETPCSNFDSIFTGLTPAEANYVYENFEDCKSLKIAPVQPCLLNLPKLKFLMFTLEHPKPCKKNLLSDSAFLTRVTGHCAFARMPKPKLEVLVRRRTCRERANCNLALDHLKAFVPTVLLAIFLSITSKFWTLEQIFNLPAIVR
ncbi:unnamed protein product [Allacma fusca]|uniref:F-box domain-containing protein n=1 Tax=Allacma fusca TaxID=39272 RepID=A0A8J2K1L2_9HEXA|nr:unnamed protein product [Allacma fusca]